MGQSLYLPGAVIVIGLLAALFFARPEGSRIWNTDSAAAGPGTEADANQAGQWDAPAATSLDAQAEKAK